MAGSGAEVARNGALIVPEYSHCGRLRRGRRPRDGQEMVAARPIQREKIWHQNAKGRFQVSVFRFQDEMIPFFDTRNLTALIYPEKTFYITDSNKFILGRNVYVGILSRNQKGALLCQDSHMGGNFSSPKNSSRCTRASGKFFRPNPMRK